jgi:hypothetical protein
MDYLQNSSLSLIATKGHYFAFSLQFIEQIHEVQRIYNSFLIFGLIEKYLFIFFLVDEIRLENLCDEICGNLCGIRHVYSSQRGLKDLFLATHYVNGVSDYLGALILQVEPINLLLFFQLLKFQVLFLLNVFEAGTRHVLSLQQSQICHLHQDLVYLHISFVKNALSLNYLNSRFEILLRFLQITWDQSLFQIM